MTESEFWNGVGEIVESGRAETTWNRRDDAAVKSLVEAANAVQRLVYDDKLRAELQQAVKMWRGYERRK